MRTLPLANPGREIFLKLVEVGRCAPVSINRPSVEDPLSGGNPGGTQAQPCNRERDQAEQDNKQVIHIA